MTPCLLLTAVLPFIFPNIRLPYLYRPPINRIRCAQPYIIQNDVGSADTCRTVSAAAAGIHRSAAAEEEETTNRGRWSD